MGKKHKHSIGIEIPSIKFQLILEGSYLPDLLELAIKQLKLLKGKENVKVLKRTWKEMSEMII